MVILQTEAQVNKRKKIIRNAAIVFISIIVLLTFFSKTINNFLLPEVECDIATAGRLTNEITSQGEVVSQNTATIYSYGTWKIKGVKVKEGDTVKKGLPLAVIDVEDIRLEIKKMELNILKMENDLVIYKNGLQAINLDLFKEDVEVAQKAVKKAEKKMNDQKALYAYDAVTLESVNEAEEQLEIAKRDYENKQKLLNQKEEESKKSGDDYQITVQGKEAELEVCRLELESKKKNVPEDGIIKSTMNGTVNSVYIENGTITNGGQALFDIIKSESTVSIKWTLDSKVSSMVSKKDMVEFKISEPEKLSLNGTVKEKKYLAKEGVYEYISEIKDASDKLEIGQKVDVLIDKPSKSYPTIVPNGSVIKEGGKTYIFIVQKKDGVLGEEYYVDKLEVKVLETGDFNSAISVDDILAEENIIVFSTKALSNKMQVKLRLN
jgi:HlyD family secretion protein